MDYVMSSTDIEDIKKEMANQSERLLEVELMQKSAAEKTNEITSGQKAIFNKLTKISESLTEIQIKSSKIEYHEERFSTHENLLEKLFNRLDDMAKANNELSIKAEVNHIKIGIYSGLCGAAAAIILGVAIKSMIPSTPPMATQQAKQQPVILQRGVQAPSKLTQP